MLRCRLCWRIGISIFAAIFLVEAAVLIFSAARFESDRLNEIENRGRSWITTITRVHNNVLDAAAIDAASRELPQLSKILGLALYDAGGAFIGGFGERPSLTPHQIASDPMMDAIIRSSGTPIGWARRLSPWRAWTPPRSRRS